MNRRFKWTTPEEAEREELRYRRSRPPAERVAAVEVIREATGMYGDGLVRMERIYRLFVQSPNQPGHATSRSRGPKKTDDRYCIADGYPARAVERAT